jgi:peptidoglycan-associated lipoprotein
MKYLKIFLVLGCVVFLASCACPKKLWEIEKEKVSILKPEPVAPPPAGVTAPPAPVETGKAAPVEIAKATKGEEIPQTKIPAEKKFVPPEQVSEKAGIAFKNIYFDYDKYDLKVPAQVTLEKIGHYLRDNPKIEVVIEGHCDERGTREYNLVLGERRSLSARRFLVSMGVAGKRLHTVSYGEDRPADPASNEEAWAKNRRCEFKISTD